MKFMSVDPGTFKTGLARWEDSRLIDHQLVECPARMAPEERIGFIKGVVLEQGRQAGIDLLVSEQVVHIEGRPNEALALLYKGLRRMAKQQRWKWDFYHPSRVKKAVHVSGYGPRQTKEMMRMGVCFFYGMELRYLDQNEIDAIAVGLAHLGKLHEANTISQQKIETRVR